MDKKNFGLYLILALFLIVIETGLEIKIDTTTIILQTIVLFVGIELYTGNL